MDTDRTFAKNLKLLRETNRYSQGAFSRRLEEFGLSLAQQSIYKIESNSRRVTIGEAATIAVALGVDLKRMITENVGFRAEVSSPDDIETMLDFSKLPEEEQVRIQQGIKDDVLASMSPRERQLYEMELGLDSLRAQIAFLREVAD